MAEEPVADVSAAEWQAVDENDVGLADDADVLAESHEMDGSVAEP